MAPAPLIAFGFGYVAGFLAPRLAAVGASVTGTSRTPAGAAALGAAGFEGVVWPGATFEPPAGTAWLVSVPPDEQGCPVFRAFGAMAATSHWIGYLSTTGVYGDLGGGWAFEETPVNPQSREARHRTIAEAQWTSVGASLFRLPGIYGPGRSQLERLREPGARRIIKPGQVFSRIHADDLAALLQMSIASGRPPSVYNVCDDEPAPSDVVLAHAADLLGRPPPPAIPFAEAGLSPAAQRFYAECKRVSNARAKAAFGWRPRFPTYREGLADCLGHLREGRPFA